MTATPRRDSAAASGSATPPVTSVTPYTRVHHLSRAVLERIQDIIVLSLCAVLFLIMARSLFSLALQALDTNVDVRALLSQVLFVTVLVELYRLLIIYLRDHHVAVDAVVEVALVSALREVVLRGVTDLEWPEMLAITAFVLGLGTLLRFGDLQLARRDGAGRSRRSRHRE